MRMGSQPSADGVTRESVARQRGNHDIERVRCAPAMRGRIRQRIDDFQLLDDRAWPSVGDDDRQRVRILRPHMDEVNVHAIDFGGELRESVQPRLDLAPVVLRLPIAREFLHRRKWYALRVIRDDLLLRPTHRRDAAFQIRKRLIRKVNAEGLDRRDAAGSRARCVRLCIHRCGTHDDDPPSSATSIQTCLMALSPSDERPSNAKAARQSNSSECQKVMRGSGRCIVNRDYMRPDTRDRVYWTKVLARPWYPSFIRHRYTLGRS